MAVPGFQQFFLPLLELAGDGQEHTIRELAEAVAQRLGLNEVERNELLSSGGTRMMNRLSWARTYLQKAGLLQNTGRARFRITARGQEVLQKKPHNLSITYLKQFPEFLHFYHGATVDDGQGMASHEIIDKVNQTPQEMLETAYQTLKGEIVREVLERVKQCSPQFFEQLVLDLLLAMGYGGSRREAGQALGRSRDGGVDGVINEDRLGLDRIYVQAKRWQGSVGRPEVQAFAGALMGHKARKGVFLSTGTFTEDAQRYARSVDNLTIVLIDGLQLARLMVDHDVGVTEETRYVLKKIDQDYFED